MDPADKDILAATQRNFKLTIDSFRNGGLKMESRNDRQPVTTRNQGSEKPNAHKEGPATKLSGLSIRGRGRAPLAEISTNQRNTNSQMQGGAIFNGSKRVSNELQLIN